MSKETIIKILEEKISYAQKTETNSVVIDVKLALEIIRALFQEDGKGY